MAQAQGGTAGSSSTRGNGSLSAGAASRGGGLGGGLGGSNGGSNNAGNSKGNAASSNAASGASTGAAAAGATAAAAGDSKQTGGSLMGGLKSAVDSARSSRTAAAAPSTSAPQGALSASDVAGIDSESHSAAANLAARDQGFRDTANAKTTASVMGGLGSIVSAVGNVAGKIASAAAPNETSDLGMNHNVGKAWANSVGPSKTVSMAASLAGGILGGPIGSALAGFALGIANDQAAKAANPQAMAATPQQIANRATFGQQASTSSSGQFNANPGANADNNGGGGGMASIMSAAAQPGAGFQAADDFSEQRKVDGLNLGSII